jgi:hypothetical protein
MEDVNGHIAPNGHCEFDIVECSTAYGEGTKVWDKIGKKYGSCIEESCIAGYKLVGGACTSCDKPNALSYKTVENGECVVDLCKAGYHSENGGCEEDVKSCYDISNGDGEKKWVNGTWGGCLVSDCDDGYHAEGNVCISNDDHSCVIDNGNGVRHWIGSAMAGQWGPCEANSCNPGYTSERALTNEWSKPCGRCNNYYGYDGKPAVGSYSSECDIAVCMYHGEKYVLQDGECVLICEERSDDTGMMAFDSSVNKCKRTCETGYKMW